MSLQTHQVGSDLSVDVVDDNGEELPHVDTDLKKIRISNDGKVVGSYNTATGKPGEKKCMRCYNSDGFGFLCVCYTRLHSNLG